MSLRIRPSNFLFPLLLLLFGSCAEERPAPERYAEQLAAARTTSQRTDEIFLDMHFGMTRSEFYTHCTELNKQRIIREGEGGATVRWDLPDKLKSPAHLVFSPEFTEDESKIFAMNFSVKYDSWAPWAKDFNSLELLKDFMRSFSPEYGDDWLVLPHDDLGRVVTQIDENRRLTLWLEGQERVRGRFTDLSQVPDEPLIDYQSPTIPTLPSGGAATR